MADDLRTRFTAELKTAMLAKDAARTSSLRMITAKLKDVDIAARPSGVDKVPDDQIIAMLRGMVKSRAESAALYRQGNRLDLAEKEEAEIAVIEGFLPQQMDEAAMAAAVEAAVAEAGATSVKDMGKVMALLRAQHGAVMDMAKAGPLVKARLGA
ncbi:GatB/YqeY domain-containing protein [Falsiroseomonas sp. HC035]|uniref:GatB/YqeY domain-containing protein n=1 Tax=Falsiroseomonas sp. HC035 TaxID=3390999 RepID=UPI003D313EB4